ncbi:MAG: hypothetical protein ABL917_04020 [Parcubacteria group bacterium]
MEYFYHEARPDMKGTILYPLNFIKDIYPEIYFDRAKKYEGREDVLRVEIPPLGCLWNDVIHLTAVTPEKLKENLAQAGFHFSKLRHFKIPLSMLDQNKMAYFTHRKDSIGIYDPKKFELFDKKKMSEYKQSPEDTIEHYKEMKAEGKRPLAHAWAPHILYNGTIETKDLEII